MIEVTRLKGKKMMINAELIETVEETPDTVITLVIGYKRKIFALFLDSGNKAENV